MSLKIFLNLSRPQNCFSSLYCFHFVLLLVIIYTYNGVLNTDWLIGLQTVSCGGEPCEEEQLGDGAHAGAQPGGAGQGHHRGQGHGPGTRTHQLKGHLHDYPVKTVFNQMSSQDIIQDYTVYCITRRIIFETLFKVCLGKNV